MNDEDVKELIGLSSDAVKKGNTSLPEARKLLHEVENAKRETKSGDGEEVSEDEIAALLKQLGEGEDDNDESNVTVQETPGDKSNDGEEKLERSEEGLPGKDDSDEIAAVLAQLTDEARLESKFEDSSSESPFPSVSKLPLPSLPSLSTDTAEDDLLSRISNLKNLSTASSKKTSKPGVINTIIPSLAKRDEDDDMENWCGTLLHLLGN